VGEIILPPHRSDYQESIALLAQDFAHEAGCALVVLHLRVFSA
jgi:hypothetical protein